jgi:hypothetical protein
MENKTKLYFDDLIENDKRGKFLQDFSAKCFNTCVDKITDSNLSNNEKTCLLDCYSKMYYTYKMGMSSFKESEI